MFSPRLHFSSLFTLLPSSPPTLREPLLPYSVLGSLRLPEDLRAFPFLRQRRNLKGLSLCRDKLKVDILGRT